jgi:hypothetical protein
METSRGTSFNGEANRLRPSEGTSTVAEQELNNASDDQEGRILPTTIRSGENPTIAGVHPDDGAQQSRQQHQHDPTGLRAQDQKDAANRLGRECNIGKPARQADADEEAGSAGETEAISFKMMLWARYIVPRATRSRNAVVSVS